MHSDSELRKKALVFVWIGEIWNVFEATVAIWAALLASSVALLAFGLDSIIELFAGAVMLWRFWKERQDKEATTERTALRLIGVTFFLLSAFIIFQSIATLLGYFAQPSESVVGIFITISSAVLMTVLFFYKTRIAKKIGSRALRAEAYQSLICDLQDLVVLVGLGLIGLFGWWWADPLMAQDQGFWGWLGGCFRGSNQQYYPYQQTPSTQPNTGSNLNQQPQNPGYYYTPQTPSQG
ncbi:MAG: cation transporter [Candidatus Bathyarchaeota archaeon]